MGRKIVTGLAVAIAGVATLALTTGQSGGSNRPGIVVVRGGAPIAKSSPVRRDNARRDVALTTGGAAAAARRFTVRLLVPAYFYPSASGSDWDVMQAALPKVAVTAIMNPASGPDPAGSGPNPDYTRAVNAFRAAGGVVIGYVPSGYSGRRVSPGSSCKPAVSGATTYTVDDVANCAARYAANYAIDGIFVDEMGVLNGRPASEGQTFYTELYDRLKMTRSTWMVFGNPGTAAPEAYLRKGRAGGADSLVTYEDAAANYASTPPVSYAANYQARRFGNILYAAPRGFDINGALAKAKANNSGYLYITDDVLPNPYDRLPSNWTRLVNFAAKFNRTN